MTPEQRQYIAELEEYLRPIEADGKACYRQDVDRRALLTIIDELEQQNARLREFVLAVKEMREAQLNAGATGYRNGAFNAAQREAEKKVNEILEAL